MVLGQLATTDFGTSEASRRITKAFSGPRMSQPRLLVLEFLILRNAVPERREAIPSGRVFANRRIAHVTAIIFVVPCHHASARPMARASISVIGTTGSWPRTKASKGSSSSQKVRGTNP